MISTLSTATLTATKLCSNFFEILRENHFPLRILYPVKSIDQAREQNKHAFRYVKSKI